MERRSLVPRILAVVIAGVAGGLVWWVRGDVEPQAAGQPPSDERSRLEASPLPLERTAMRESLGALAAETQAGLGLLCVDRSGRPVEGASVHVRSEEGTRLLARTGPEGRVSGKLEQAPPYELLAAHPEFATARAWIGSPPDQDVTLVLGPRGVLQGRVELVGGGPCPRGVLVAAVPERTYLATFRRAHVDWLADPEVVATSPDTLGGFLLEGLQTGVTYRVLAGGEGYVETKTTKALPSDEAFLQLEVARLHAVWLRYVEPNFFPARIGKGVVANEPVTISVQKSQGTLVPMSLAVHLALPAPELRDLPPNEQLVLVVASAEAPEIGPLFVKGSLPGYARFEQRVFLPPVSVLGGPLDVVLAPESSGWGELELCFTGGRPRSEVGPVVSAWAQVALRPEGRAQEHQWPVRGALDGCKTLGPIPAGRYRLEVRGLPVEWKRAPRQGALIEILPGAATPASIDLAGLASAELLVDSGARSFDGALNVDVWFEEEGKGHGGTVLFEAPPYLVPTLPPGKYSFCLRSPRSAEPWRKVELLPGLVPALSWTLMTASPASSDEPGTATGWTMPASLDQTQPKEAR